MDCTPRSGQRADRVVAVDAVRELDDEHEPAADVAAEVLARQLQTLEAGQRLAVPAGGPRAVGEHAVEPVELRQTQGARHVGQAVVEAEPVVVEPAHVGRATLVALGVDVVLCSSEPIVSIPPSPVTSCLLA